jgi:cytochrome c oxidase cbb3-type subunit III
MLLRVIGLQLQRLAPFCSVLLFAMMSVSLECCRPLTAVQKRGRALYERMCFVCHGRAGEGYAADEAPALSQPNFLASVSDEYLRSAIADGRRGTTMSAWAVARGGPLSREDIDAIIGFLRSWQRGRPAALDERPVLGVASRGGDVFARECARCHGLLGVGGPEVHVGNPELLATAGNGFLRYALRLGRTGTAMPGFERKLGAAGVEDLMALLRSWQSAAPAAPPPPVRPAKIPLGSTPINPHGPEPVGFHAQPEVTKVDVVKAQLDRGARMGLLDARAPSDYLGNHIAGAVSVPFYDLDPYLASLPKDAWLVCYCACPHAESGQLAQKLLTSGFKKVTVLDEGFNVWRAKNYPIRSGIDP